MSPQKPMQDVGIPTQISRSAPVVPKVRPVNIEEAARKAQEEFRPGLRLSQDSDKKPVVAKIAKQEEIDKKLEELEKRVLKE